MNDDLVHEVLQALLDVSATGSMSAVSDARKGIRTLLDTTLTTKSDEWERVALNLWAVCIHLQRRQLQQEVTECETG